MSDYDLEVERFRSNISLIQETIRDGFPRLFFPASLEEQYALQHYGMLLHRVPIISTYALAMLLIYCVSDYAFLPASVHEITIGIRVVVIAPVLVFIVWCGLRKWPYRRYLAVYTGAYLIAGFSIIAIIMTARLQDIPMPYEGLLLMSLFGYLLLGLPFYHALGASLILFVCYFLGEWLTGLPLNALAYNAFFLLTANAIGAVGCYLHERTLRTGFLTQLLVEQSRDEAELENEGKSRLLAAASHDLRQPLHAMTLFAEQLSNDLPSGRSLDTAKHLQSSISHLNQLLGSLLDMSRLQYGVIKPRFSQFRLYPLVEQAVREIYHGDHTQVRVHADLEETVVFSDPLLLGRILRNLIDNALEHAQAKEVWVRLTQKSNGEVVHVSVEDDGKGINADQQALIFKEFHQIDKYQATGLGLGLAIVKQMTQMLDLKLTLDSEAGVGSRFGFDLPLVKDGAESRAEQGSSFVSDNSITDSRLRILMAEDGNTVRQAAVELVQGWGYQVDQAESVEEAQRLIEKNAYALLITDYHFCDESTGLDLVRALRSSGDMTPIIVLTADMQLELDEQALAPILVAHKPIKPAKLRLMINQLST